jgi:ABC-type nickel/cobalt efflux system permease component RcnA
VKRYWNEMNPTLRGFLIIALVALIVVVLQLYQTLVALGLLLRIAFFLAIAFVLYLLWRDRMRHEIETWSKRSRAVFYGAAALILVDLGVFFWPDDEPTAGPDALAFLLVLALAGFSMWRVWRDEHSYGL